MQSLVNAQLDISRAVFAYNLSALEIVNKKHLTFKTLEQRNLYVLQCMKSAVCELTESIEKLEIIINK